MNEAKYYYLDRAAYLRGLAQDAQSPQLRMSCLKAAADYDALAQKAQTDDPLPKRANRDSGLPH